ncbi:MAG: phenylacetate--CoA ligase [Clostridia bacterium]|nr:phenylacetate--CoA ligase [Clostridia bacterium]
MYWDKIHECLDRNELKELQSRRLVETVKRCYYNVPFYREAFQKANIMPEDIKGIEDLHKLPFTTKQDLRDNYPYGLFATPLENIVRIHASSGTTGKPTVVGYTRHDLASWAELMARTLVSAGATSKSVIQVAFGYGLFTGGLGAHYGTERLGASVIPASGGNTKKQIMLMKDFGTELVCCTPSYALYMAEVMEEMGINPNELKLKYAVLGAEPWTESMRKEIERRLGVRTTDIYGLSEVMGPGVAYECFKQEGMHINEDHFIAEIIDPNTLEPLPLGEKGELVFTTITKEGIPLIRYRTRDITSLEEGQCECGRTFIRMKKVMGRSDDMIIIRGVNVFPTQIETVLIDMAGIAPYYMLIVDRVDNLDVLEIQVELTEELFTDEISQIEQIRERLAKEIYSVIGINAKITLVEPKTLPRTEGKAQHVIDKRVID